MALHATWPLRRVVDRLNRLGGIRKLNPWRPRTASDLDRILTWLAAEHIDAEEDLAFDNVVARREYLDDTPTLTAVQIHRMSGLVSSNRSEPASRWKKEGKTFAVRLGRIFHEEEGEVLVNPL